MGKSRITDEFNKMLKDKKFRNILVICLVAVFLLITINVFQGSSSFGSKLTSLSSSKNNKSTGTKIKK